MNTTLEKIIWIIPVINICLIHIGTYTEVALFEILRSIFILFHIVLSIVIPFLILKKGIASLKRVAFCITSIGFANILLVVPDSYFYFSESDYYEGTIPTFFLVIWITMVLVIGLSFALLYIKKMKV